MTLNRLLAPLLGAAIFAIAALVGAGAANAHPGHAHASAVAAPAASEVVPPASEVVPPASEVVTPLAEAAIAMTLAVGAAEYPVLSEVESSGMPNLVVAVEAGRGAPDAPCRGMCCDNTPCGCCVQMAFGKSSLPAPLLGTWVRNSVEARKLAGRLAEGPNEPPRTFI